MLINRLEQLDKKFLQIQIGKRIKQLRESKNISQVDLAASCNFEKSNMSRIEAGNTCPNVFTLYKIANNLKVELFEIFKLPKTEE